MVKKPVPAKVYTVEIAPRDDSMGVTVTTADGELVASVADGRGTVPMAVLLGEVAARITEHAAATG